MIAHEAQEVVRGARPTMIALMRKAAAIMDLECSVPISKLSEQNAQVDSLSTCA